MRLGVGVGAGAGPCIQRQARRVPAVLAAAQHNAPAVHSNWGSWACPRPLCSSVPSLRIEDGIWQPRSSTIAGSSSRRSSSPSPRISWGSDVKNIPGIGKKSATVLGHNGINTAGDLVKLYFDTLNTRGNVQEVLEAKLGGMRNDGHMNNTLAFLEKEGRRLAQESGNGHIVGNASANQTNAPSWLTPKVTLSVEGNISAGKSTFLKMLQSSAVLQQKLQVVPEPVDKWQNVGQGQVNLLMEFYKAPERFAYTFQNYVFLTRVVQERDSYTSAQMCRLLERSVFSDRMVFVRAVHAAKYMNDTELTIYDAWFDPVLSTLPTLVPNGFVYLRAAPGTCHRRLKRRAREEETSVQLSYLQELHERHEDWLHDGGEPMSCAASARMYLCAQPPLDAAAQTQQAGASAAAPAFGAAAVQGLLRFSLREGPPPSGATGQGGLVAGVPLPPLPAVLDRCVRFMDVSRGQHMHPLLHTVPTLVLDCDTDVDVEGDAAYQAAVVAKVSAFADYVRALMVARAGAMLALEHETAAAAATSSASGGEESSSGEGAPFRGYAIDVKGTTLYVDQHAPLIAYATRGQRDGTMAPSALTGLEKQSTAESARETVGSTGGSSWA